MKPLQLNFRAGIPEKDLLGRVMGPDMYGAMYYVVTVFSLPDRTTVNLWPERSGNRRVDEVGQEWIMETP